MKLRKCRLIFDEGFGPQMEVIKQVFWLNLLNFMTLYKLAEIQLSRPDALQELTSYAMWQAFFENNYIYIQDVKINQLTIYHSILR